jgi:hypothetical protein
MKRLPVAPLLLGASLLAACGGQSAAEFQNAAPSYAALSMDLSTTATTGATTGMTPMAKTAAPGADLVDPACHPHLFLRAEALAARVNRHLWKFLRRVENVTTHHPDRLTAGSATWTRTQGTVEIQWTITKLSDQAFTWLLQMRPVGGTTWTDIFSGQIDRTGATGPHQGKGNAHLDLTALHGLTGEPSTGTLAATFETFADHRLIVVDATSVVWDASDIAVDPYAVDLGTTPRNAHYVYFHEPGKGGSFKAHDEMVFLCPAPNTSLLPADAKVLTRWYRTSSGTVNGRSDALMVGGQLPATDSIEGVVCHAGSGDGQPQTEAYWMMKEEDSTGATVGTAWGPVGDPASCDTVFGAVPSATSNAGDFDFTKVNFDDATPADFPGK